MFGIKSTMPTSDLKKKEKKRKKRKKKTLNDESFVELASFQFLLKLKFYAIKRITEGKPLVFET